MNLSATIPTSWMNDHLSDGLHAQLYRLFIATLMIVLLPVAYNNVQSKNRFPIANPPKWFQLQVQKEKEFVNEGLDILHTSHNQYSSGPFTLLTNTGERIVLPSSFAHTIRNITSLNFGKAIKEDFFGHLPGMEPFGLLVHPSEVLQKVVRKQLTKRLNSVIEPLSSEAVFAVNHIFGNAPDWREIRITESILELIARVSSRVFLGEELCRNEEWLKITQLYTLASFQATQKLRDYPGFIRPLVNLFHPLSRVSRAALRDTHRLIGQLVEKRKQLKEKCHQEGLPVPTFNDAIEWGEEEAKGYSYDPAVLQLTLSFAAIHTTTDLLSQVILRLAREPENIGPLRKEIVEVLQVEGWSKTALFKMKLLDSAIKEAQRLKPNDLLEMRRFALEDVTLPDGTFIRKGERVLVDNTTVTSSDVYDNPEKFDIYRFRRMRDEPGKEHIAQLVSTSPDHLSFGHGKHACPGRFFAANEIKLSLCHLLLKYDWRLGSGGPPKPLVCGTALTHNPESVVQFRRRKEEIDLESLEISGGIDTIDEN